MIGKVLQQYGLLPLSAAALGQLETYLDLLLFWNSRQNLTAIRDREAIVSRHFVESVFCAQTLARDATVLDFGSGAGFPGIPAAIARPDLRVTLAESQGKKAAFLREAVRKLDLSAKVHAGRVETLPANALFDYVTMRAVDKTLEALPHAWARVQSPGELLIFTTARSAVSIWETLSAQSWVSHAVPGSLSEGILLCGAK